MGAENRILGSVDRKLEGVRSIERASEGDLAFCVHLGPRGVEMVSRSGAAAIICNERLAQALVENPTKTFVLVKNPRLAFIRVFRRFFEPARPIGISRSARIGKRCSIARDVFIGENVIIGNCVTIGEHSEIHSGVSIYDNVRIGNRVVVHAGAVIGSDGFGYERNDNGELEKFPHMGSVVIGDSVEIGANTCIDRGALNDTVIGKGTKIDNLVHIAHNVHIGNHCIIVALSMIGGGAKVSDYSWVAPSASIRDGLSVGARSTIGMGAVVTKDVPDDVVVYGVPAKPKRQTGEKRHGS